MSVRASLALLALMTGCLTGGGRDQGTETIQEAGPISRIELDLDIGSVTVVAAPATEGARGTVESRWGDVPPEVLHYVADGVLHVLGRCDALVVACRTDVTLQVPSSASIGITTGVGTVRVEGVSGDVEAVTEDGAIDLDRVGGVVFVETGNGDITGKDLGGAIVDARTDDGTIEISTTTAPERLVAHTEGGDVNLMVPAGSYRVEAKAPNGDLVLGEAIQSDATATSVISARTNNGNIRIEGERTAAPPRKTP